MSRNKHILMITSEFPSADHPEAVPFVAREVELLQSAGLNIDVYAFRGQKKLTNYFFSWVQVHKLLKKKNYDLVHAQFGQSGLLALFPKPCPLVITYRGSDVEGIVDSQYHYTYQGRILHFISCLTALRADQCILVSKSLAKKLPKRTYQIIPSGINLNLFKPVSQNEARSKLGYLPNQRYVLFGGNPDQPVKRIGLAQEVIRIVRVQYPDLELIALRNTPHSDMPIFLNACDALLLTSIHEGSPNIIKEALACNLPIISTNVGDVKGRIGPIEGCIVCDSDDPRIISEAVITVLSHGRKIDGRKYVLDLDEDLITKEIIGVYNNVLKDRSPQ